MGTAAGNAATRMEMARSHIHAELEMLKARQFKFELDTQFAHRLVSDAHRLDELEEELHQLSERITAECDGIIRNKVPRSRVSRQTALCGWDGESCFNFGTKAGLCPTHYQARRRAKLKDAERGK